MSEKLDKYIAKKKLALSDLGRSIRVNKICYFFLLPYAVLFITFYVLPMITSIYFSFTNYNILEKPDFIGATNYLNLFLEDARLLRGVGLGVAGLLKLGLGQLHLAVQDFGSVGGVAHGALEFLLAFQLKAGFDLSGRHGRASL